MKKLIFAIGLIFLSNLVIPEAEQMPMEAMPSMQEVMANMSKEDFAKQIQETQKFFETMTPEELSQLNQAVNEIFESMPPEDKAFIQGLADHIEHDPEFKSLLEQKPSEVSAASTPNRAETIPTIATPTVDSSELSGFQSIISSIMQRIDDILQKIQSSKEASEELETKWSNKSTFSNMKRQIAQLKEKRLAQKLAKKDLADDDAELIKKLKSFLKDLTEKNDSLKIEDDFGLPTSFSQEQKYLSKTKSILNMFDTYIDSLMPKLEKFLHKWDPEALEMAKEAGIKTATAQKDALDATKRVASQPVATTGSQRATGYTPASSNYGSYENYGYPQNYYDQGGNYGQPGGSNYLPESATGQNEVAGKTTPVKSASGKDNSKPSEIQAAAGGDKTKASLYDQAINDLEGHTQDLFNQQHENKFVDFMQKLPIDYPMAPVAPDAPGNIILNSDILADAWVQSRDLTSYLGENINLTSFSTTGFKQYVVKKLEQFKQDFASELTNLHDIISSIKSNVSKMAPEDATKLSTGSAFAAIERRVSRYQEEFKKILDPLKTKFNKNNDPYIINSDKARDDYRNLHDSFIKHLENDISTKLTEISNAIDTTKRSAKRYGSKKKT